MAAARFNVQTRIQDELRTHEIIVDAPSRLHFTLIDLHGGLGRIDGGIGVALKSPRIKIRVKPRSTSAEITSDINDSIPPRIKPILARLTENLGCESNFEIELIESIPKHIGLGSNTQLAMATARAVTYFVGLNMNSSQLARLAGRGGTSGIGVATFETGGFVMDAGHIQKEKKEFLPSHFSDAAPPELMMRAEIPGNWYFVTTTPYIGQGLHGEQEADIFKQHCPIPRVEVEKLSHLILMTLLPAIAEEDILSFGSALRTIQSIGFKRIENELQHKVVKDLYDFYYENGALGAGLSSFGPTTYALVDGEAAAKKLKTGIEKYLLEQGIAYDVRYSNVDNSGAQTRISR